MTLKVTNKNRKNGLKYIPKIESKPNEIPIPKSVKYILIFYIIGMALLLIL